MKRTTSGMEAYGKILMAVLPEKTDTYTPITHISVINRIRSEITSAGYIITGEEYRCSNDAQVATGTFRMNYKHDPDIELSATFLNSYNKQYAFRFSLGGHIKLTGNALILNNRFGSYKRVHKGDADILAEGTISKFINDSESYWSELIEHKDALKEIRLDISAFKENLYKICGDLFFDQKIINTMQLNLVRDVFSKASCCDSAWDLYNVICSCLKEGHPSTFIDDQIKTLQAVMHQFAELVEEEPIDLAAEEELVEEDSFLELPF